MPQSFRRLLLCCAAVCVCVSVGYAQDAPSIGDIARQARQQKQNKDGQSKAATPSKASKVITNEEIPEHSESADGSATAENQSPGTSLPSAPDNEKKSAEEWKAQSKRKRISSALCKAILRRSTTQFNLPPATASLVVCSGTNARSRSSRM